MRNCTFTQIIFSTNQSCSDPHGTVKLFRRWKRNIAQTKKLRISNRQELSGKEQVMIKRRFLWLIGQNTNKEMGTSPLAELLKIKISFNIHIQLNVLEQTLQELGLFDPRDTVVQMLAFYDPSQMNEEIKALEASK